MPRCGLYVRVSTAMQASNEEGSLKSQLQRLREEILSRSRYGEPWTEIKVYVDEAVSGKSLDRPRFKEMVNDLRAGTIDTVVCTELSRISRSVIDFLSFARFLQDYKANLLCLKQQFDSTNAAGRMMITILVAFAEWERESTAERTSENLLARAKRGLRNGSRVLGFDPDPTRKGYLVPNAAEKATVNAMFDKYLETGSGKAVTDYLNGAGYRTKTGGRFSTSSVHYHLANHAYIGKTEVNRGNKSRDQASLSEKMRYVTVQAVWPAIVSEAKFLAVQKLMGRNGQQRKNVAAKVIHNYVLRGLCQCGVCGSFLEDGSGTSKSGVLHFYYRHPSGTRKDGCLPSLRAEALEKVVLSRLSYLAEHGDILDDISRAANESLEQEVPEVMALLGERKREYARLTREMDALAKKVLELDDVKTIKELIAPKVDDLKAQRGQVSSEIELLQQSLGELKSNVISAIEIKEMLQSFGILYQELQPHKQCELLGYIVRGVKIWPTKIEVALFGRATLERFTPTSGVFAQTPSWLGLLRAEPAPPRHPFLRVLGWAGTRTGRFVSLGGAVVLWAAFVFQIIVGQFINYSPRSGWLNHPLVQLPWFRMKTAGR